MTKTLLLMKIELINLFVNNNFTARRNRKKTLGIAMFIIPAAAMLYLSVVYSLLLMETLPADSKFLMPVLMTVSTFIMLIVLSFYNASGHLFGFKDFDLLMSLPVKKTSVMLSKLLAFLLMDYFFAVFLIIPYIAIYGIKMGQPVLYYLYGFAGFLFVPMIPMVLSGVLALLINSLTANFRYKSLIRNLSYLLMIGLIMYGSLQLQNLMFMDMSSATALLNNIKTYALPIYLFAMALLNTDFGYIAAFILLNAVCFSLFVFAFSQVFTKVNMQIHQGYKVKNFHLKTAAVSSRFAAFFKLQVQRYFGSTMYLINTIVGPLMPIVFIIIGIFRGSDEIKIYLSLMDSQQVLLPILLASMMFTSSLCMITSSSISLEGKNLGTLKSYPLSVPEIFLAKILLQVVISVLGSAAAIVLGVIFYDLSWTYALVLLVSAIIFAVFGACFGLIINLLFPRLEWDSETIVVKQSMAVLITTFGGLAIGGLQILAYIMVIKYLSLPVFIILDLILNMILIYGMWLYLSTAGVKKFREL